MGSRGDGIFKWYWGLGEEPDYMHGPEDTRDAILQVARREADGQVFTICQADKAVPSFNIFDAEQVIERYEEHNEECWSEDGADISVSTEAARELEKLLNNAFRRWAKKHDAAGYPWAFCTQRNVEHFPATTSGEAH